MQIGRALFRGQRRAIKVWVEQKTAHGGAAGGHAQQARHGAGLRHRPDKKVRGRIDPVAAEPVLAEKLAAIRHATDRVSTQVRAREIEEAVVKRAVGTQDHPRANVVEDGAEAVHAQEPAPGVRGRGELQEIEIDVVRPGGMALDAVVQAHAETIQAMGVLQTLVNLDFVGRSMTGLAGPVDERASAHVMAAARAGGKNEGTHVLRSTTLNPATSRWLRAGSRSPPEIRIVGMGAARNSCHRNRPPHRPEPEQIANQG